MAKRYTDTNKWKTPFVRTLQGAYKLLWFFINDDCDHAGIWQVDKEVAELRVNSLKESVDWDVALNLFGQEIQVIDNGDKWFIPRFIAEQYGELNFTNKVHGSVIAILTKHEIPYKIKELPSTLQGAKEKDKDKDKDKEKEKEGVLGETKPKKSLDDLNYEQLPDEPKAAVKEVFEDQLEEPALPAEFILDEEKFSEAEKYLKSQSLYSILKMQHRLDDDETLAMFRTFYERKSAFNEMGNYLTPLALIKHFFSWIPYHRKMLAETATKKSPEQPIGKAEAVLNSHATLSDYWNKQTVH